MTVGNFDVYTVGGIEYLSQVFRGLVLVLSDSSWDTFMKISITAGVIGAVLSLIKTNKFKELSTWFISAIFAMTLFMGVKADVTIIDTKFQNTALVTGVPVGPAVLASMFSGLNYTLSRIFGNIFHTGTVNIWSLGGGGSSNKISSASLDYNRTGYAGLFDPILTLKRLQFNQIAKPEIQSFNSMIDTFLTQCTMPEISVLTAAQVESRFKSSTDLMTAIAPTVNQFITYDGTLTTCTDFYNQKLQPTYVNTVKPLFDESSTLLSVMGVSVNTSSVFTAGLTEALVGSSQTLSDYVGQAGMISAMNFAYNKYAYGGSDSGGDLAMAYQTGRSVEEARQMGKGIGLYAKEVVPLFAIALQSLYIILCPIILLLMFINNFKALRFFVMSMAWVYSWDPILAILNGFVNIGAIAKSHAALTAVGATGGLSINALNTLAETMDFIPSVAGYLGLTVPGIAMAVISGSESSLAHLAHGIVGGSNTVGTPRAGAASGAETQKMAMETGEKYGTIEHAKYAEGGAKMHAMAYQRAAETLGRGTMSKSAFGHQVWDTAKGVGEASVYGTHGFSRMAGSAAGSMKDMIASGEAADSAWMRYGDAGFTDAAGRHKEAWYQSSKTAVQRAEMNNVLTQAEMQARESRAEEIMKQNPRMAPEAARQAALSESAARDHELKSQFYKMGAADWKSYVGTEFSKQTAANRALEQERNIFNRATDRDLDMADFLMQKFVTQDARVMGDMASFTPEELMTSGARSTAMTMGQQQKAINESSPFFKTGDVDALRGDFRAYLENRYAKDQMMAAAGRGEVMTAAEARRRLDTEVKADRDKDPGLSDAQAREKVLSEYAADKGIIKADGGREDAVERARDIMQAGSVHNYAKSVLGDDEYQKNIVGLAENSDMQSAQKHLDQAILDQKGVRLGTEGDIQSDTVAVRMASQWNGLLTGDMADTLNKNYNTNGFRENMQVQYHVNQSQPGEIGYITASMQDGSGRSVDIKDGKIIERDAKGGLVGTTTKDMQGNVLFSEQSGVLDLNSEQGRALQKELAEKYKYAKTFDNQQISIMRGADGIISTARMQSGADSKEFDAYFKNTGWEKHHKELETSEKGFRGWEGYEKQVKNQIVGDVVLGNSENDKALVAAHNVSVNERMDALLKMDPSNKAHIERMRAQLSLKVGDHVSYTMDAKTGKMSSWTVERGGKKTDAAFVMQEYGNVSHISQDRRVYEAGTEGRGYVTGMVEETARELGADEETAKKWGARVAAFQGMLNEINPLMNATRGGNAVKGGKRGSGGGKSAGSDGSSKTGPVLFDGYGRPMR